MGCCPKIIVQNTIDNSTFITLVETSSVVLSSDFDFSYTATVAGDYILQMELYLLNVDAESIRLRTRLYKNAVFQVANINNQHDLDQSTTGGGISVNAISYTHNAKLSGVIVGDVIGFKLLTSVDVTVQSGSITIIKTS